MVPTNPSSPPALISHSSSSCSSSSFCCEICLEDLPISQMLPPILHQCSCADTLICRRCTASYISVAVQSGHYSIFCPLWSRDCTRPLSPISCRELVSKEVFGKWCDLTCEGNLLGFGRCYCPNRDCRELIIDECSESVIPRRIVCPGCRNGCCFRCSLPWGEQQDRHRCDRVMSVVERKKWMSCPGCKNYVEKVHGCRGMLCRCGTAFCYGCGKLNPEMRCCSPAKRMRQKFTSIKESFKSMGDRVKVFCAGQTK